MCGCGKNCVIVVITNTYKIIADSKEFNGKRTQNAMILILFFIKDYIFFCFLDKMMYSSSGQVDIILYIHAINPLRVSFIT